MISRSEVGRIASLHQKKFRKEFGLFIVEGEKSCQDLLNSHYEVEYLLATERTAKEKNLRKGRAKQFELVSMKDMQKMSSMTTPPEILCVARIPSGTTETSSWKRSLTLLLDDIRDPGNLGTIIRIADWFGIPAVVCSTNCTDAFGPKAVQAAMGSLFRVKVFSTRPDQFLEECSALRIPVFGAVLEGENIFQAPLSPHGIILIGGESHGIQPSLFPFISNKITIPSFTNAKERGPDSLNAAMAAAVICAEFRRRY